MIKALHVVPVKTVVVLCKKIKKNSQHCRNNSQVAESGKIDNLNTQIHGPPLSFCDHKCVL